jgi:hypothetical protein
MGRSGQPSDAADAAAQAAAGAARGRSCPLHYRYRPEVFDAPAPPALAGLDVLYVVGGLYGNPFALEAVLERFASETGRKRLVFNGDFHWFDADPETFTRVQRGVLAHMALRGNVETELAAAPARGGAQAAEVPDAGCGCAYPQWVGDDVVERSNRIVERLRRAVTQAERDALAALPMWLRADVGTLRLGIVHGDAQSLAGWDFAQEHLRDARHREEVRQRLARANVDAFACTHTCLPVFQGLHAAGGEGWRWILNNGAAGMPNFAGDGAGLLTRLALTPCRGSERRFGIRAREVFVDALAVTIDEAAWRERFLRQWPPGSDAHASYFERIVRGPAYRLDEAVRTEPGAPALGARGRAPHAR